MSSEMRLRMAHTESPRFPPQCMSTEGKSGPKGVPR